jgi:hypothetical protein
MGNDRNTAGRVSGGDAAHGGNTTMAKFAVTLPSRPTEVLTLLIAVLSP